ncbi:LOW QUALITY PROTEIN: hypothetical protein V2J09_007761 [Rumex salicifolius]
MTLEMIIKSPAEVSTWFQTQEASEFSPSGGLQTAPIARPNCTDNCGGVSIPYPFGIGVGCFLDHWFEIECKASSTHNGSISIRPYLANFSNLEVMEIATEYNSQLIVGMPPTNTCVAETRTSINFTGTPFLFSARDNVFMVEGCSGSAVLKNESKKIKAECGTVCSNSNTPAILKNGCNGVECCQTLISSDTDSLSFYHIDGSPQSCLTATLISSDSANQYIGKLSGSSDHAATAAPPVVLSWSWISKLKPDNNPNALCRWNGLSLSCYCRAKNTFGNAYVSNGCQVPAECKGCLLDCYPNRDEKTREIIQNSYSCWMTLKMAAILGKWISFGVVLLVIGLLYRFVKRRREIKRRAKFFKRNGGLLLHQQLASNEGIVEGTKIFTISELDKATNHFNENRILGQGGQGTVYKGMLVDGRFVAIKKAKLLNESQLEQFINEVVILSQINHRNVVKLLGCCLETEVPLLVYEFIPNGTLFEHIHDPDEDLAINWKKRLKIVLDSACAIAYLHSSSSIPIYHRDIKSSNILLDERHRAKVSDFGSSKTIAIDQTHLTTLVQGTMGYLDPEYFQSYQFTDKSDVYSFGVVLLELLTSKTPIYRDASSTEQKNLVTEFSSLMEQSALSNILDPEVVKEAKEDELMAFIELATRCISRSGKLRPTMKEVAMTLEMIIKSPAQVSTLFQQQAYESAENAITEASVKIPYPFGMGTSNCFLEDWFEIDCRSSPSNHTKLHGSNMKPFLSKLNLQVMDLDVGEQPNQVRVRLPPLNMCSITADKLSPFSAQGGSIDLSTSPFSFSTHFNVLMMEGCAGTAVLINQSNIVTAGCGTVCPKSSNTEIPTNSCFRVNCCQAPLVTGGSYHYYSILFYLQSPTEVKNCMVATLVDTDYVNESVGKLSSSDLGSFPPVRLNWNWPQYLDRPRHNRHAFCYSEDRWGCICKNNFDGNPYLPDGCQGPEECEDCKGYCYNQRDSSGEPIPGKYYCENGPLLNLAAIIGLGTSFGLLLLMACVYGLYRFIKRRREMKRRAKFFKRNGGLLLQQQLVSSEGIVEKTKIFTVRELNKATDHFNENRILGQGGQGTVYKGMLADGSIVAIKKAKLLDETQLEQFINEVVILSRINHRHVVKLFGCCLETEVPLLVYEFIPNGTLFEHIHDPDEDFALSWEMRLKIAADSAGAIAYLHSSASIPIYHRDIKSSNILLDEKYRAKVSDFGSSKTIAMDQTHLTTLVQGTMGYLDPEYFQSYQFTEKSDVYSFGVVILELLTSKKPIYREGNIMEQKNLVTEFLFLTQDSRLSNILDPKIVGQAKEDELNSVVELVKRCVSWSGKLRPTMKEVAMTLEMIMKSPAQVSSWYQQQEDIPILYAGYDEFDMGGVSDAEFIWTTLPSGVMSSSGGDEHPLIS